MIEKVNKMPRVVLIGSSGFVGKNLSHRLHELNCDVLSISSKDIDLSKEDSHEQLRQRLLPEDCVVVLSALTPDKGRGTDTFIKNIQIADNVSKALSAFKEISHVIYFSSDAVYSMNESLVDEATKPSPDDLYGAMHLSREIIFKSTGFPLTIVRPTLIYGAGDTHNSYGPNRLIRQALKEGKMSLFGQGEETRSHIYIKDVCNLIVEVIKGRTLGIFNLATANSTSYWDLAHKIKSCMDTNVEIITSERKNPPTHRNFDISKLYEVFPSFLFTFLEEGLTLMVNSESKVHEKN